MVIARSTRKPGGAAKKNTHSAGKVQRKTTGKYQKKTTGKPHRKTAVNFHKDTPVKAGRKTTVKFQKDAPGKVQRRTAVKFQKDAPDKVQRKSERKVISARRFSKEMPKTGHESELIRLNKYIASTGVCSRREADELITAGLVTINGKLITELGVKVSPGDVVKYNGETLKEEKKVYILMNKPKDYVTTVEDPHAKIPHV